MLELKKGQTILKERMDMRQAKFGKYNRRLFFSILQDAGYVKVQRGGRTVVIKRNLIIK